VSIVKKNNLINESNISRGKVKCPFCYYEFKLINNLKNRDGPLEQRLYAKMVVNENNEKIYYKTTEEDIKLYQKASDELKRIEYLYPKTELADGHEYKNRQLIMGTSIGINFITIDNFCLCPFCRIELKI